MECIVVATMAGRTLLHGKTLESLHTTEIANMCHRHQELNKVLSQRMHFFSEEYPPLRQMTDPMLLFVGMMWRVVVLCFTRDTASSALLAEQNPVAASDQTKISSVAAQEAGTLAVKLARFNWFKVRPALFRASLTGAS